MSGRFLFGTVVAANRADNRARLVALILLVMVGLLVPGCGQSQPIIVTTGVETGRPSALDLKTILDRRATALREGAEQAYLADLDHANQNLIQHERMVFANLRQFKLADFHFVLPEETVPQPAGQQGTYHFSPVIEEVQLTSDSGPPGVQPGESFEYDLTKRAGKWVITGLVPLTYPEVVSRKVNTDVYANAPWDMTPLHVAQVGDIWLAGDDSVGDLQPYAAAGAAELSMILALWGDRARFPGFVLFFSRSVDTLRAWYDLGARIDKSEGVAIPQEGVRKDGQVYEGQYVGSRIVVNLSRVAMFGDDPNLVMRHELTHGVTARAMSVSTYSVPREQWVGPPRWALEGFARFVENIDSPGRQDRERAILAQGIRAGRFGGQPVLSQNFYDGDAFAVTFNYDLGSSIFRFVSQTQGTPAAVELYSAVVAYRETAEGFVATPAFDGICKRVLQMSGGDFLRQWAGFVRAGG